MERICFARVDRHKEILLRTVGRQEVFQYILRCNEAVSLKDYSGHEGIFNLLLAIGVTVIYIEQRCLAKLQQISNLQQIRMSEQGLAELQDLPPELIDTILTDIQRVCGFKGLASCRLVSKAWLAAVQQYSGKAGCTANADNLERLCQILPNMASVAVSSDPNSACFNLRPLRSCSQLTSIELVTTAAREQGFQHFTILDLPSTVKEAKVRNIHVDHGSLARSTSSLTSLRYQLDYHMFFPSIKPAPHPGGNPLDIALWHIWDWMQKWEYLEEVILDGTYSNMQPFVEYLGNTIASLPRLRRLVLERPRIPDLGNGLIKPPMTLTNLRDLSLSSTNLPQKWFKLAFTFLPNLKALRLDNCTYSGAATYMKAETRVLDLKSLDLWQSSTSVLHLVSTGLESLQLNLRHGDRKGFGPFAMKAGSLKCLTRLELYYLQRCPAYNSLNYPRSLRGLPLQELALHHCGGLELDLLVPGALLSLTRLHIEDFQEPVLEDEGQQQEIQELAGCGRIILGLPHLTELSGSSALFSFGIGEELEAWKVSPYPKSVVRKHTLIETCKLKVWCRP